MDEITLENLNLLKEIEILKQEIFDVKFEN